MPKILDPIQCHKCHSCSLGCKYNARWTGEWAIDEAVQNGAEIMTDTWVDQVIIENGKVTGLAARTPDGWITISAVCVILAAGGLGTPVILQHSGIEEAGSNLFIDTFVNVYGVTKGLSLAHEPQMAMVNLQFHHEEGFLLSPFANLVRQIRFLETGVQGSLLSNNNFLGIMVKTRDDGAGRVFPDGKVSKPVTPDDRRRLKRGSQMAEEILVKAGADPRSILVSSPEGAHPGGTAAIGTVVDENCRRGSRVCSCAMPASCPAPVGIIKAVEVASHLALPEDVSIQLSE